MKICFKRHRNLILYQNVDEQIWMGYINSDGTIDSTIIFEDMPLMERFNYMLDIFRREMKRYYIKEKNQEPYHRINPIFFVSKRRRLAINPFKQ